MEKDFPILSVDNPDWDTIGGGIHSYNIRKAGEDNGQNLCFMIQGPEEEALGGVIAAVHWDWLYIDLMWIKEEFRGLGYGRRLLEMVEDKARLLGAKNAYLDTFSFQAPGFYQKFGYQVFGELKDFPVGFQRFYLSKTL
ncbi:MAG: GNAT family N-acetyltransferase [Anaerolineales bacterium]|nr:GNAT family N-acetyltransferase [Anaerolineales bacterium]